MSNASWGPPPPPAGPPGGWPPPPPPPPSRGNHTLIAVLSVGLAVVLAGTIGVVSLLSRPETRTAVTTGPATSSRPSTAAPSPSAPTSATAAPPTQQPTKAAPSPTRSPSTVPEPKTPNTSMKKNTLYSINLSGQASCKAKIRRPKPPVSNSKLAPYLRTVVDCLVNAFRAPLAKAGFTVSTPKVQTFKKSIKTPCGTLRSNSNPAFYCGGTIYWPVSSDDGREAYTFARMGYVGLTAHEFGHHLQAVTGLLYGYGYQYSEASSSARYALSRRLELQAQCFEGVFLSQSKKAIKLSSRDRSEIRTWHSYTGDEDPPSSRKPDHGSSKAQVRWLERGLEGADFGNCNTWSASKSAVK